MKQLEFSFIVFGDNYGNFVETTHTLTIISMNCVNQHLPTCIENTCPHKNLTWMFLAVLYVSSETWKQLISPSIDEWIKKCGTPDNGILSDKNNWAIKPWIDMEDPDM